MGGDDAGPWVAFGEREGTVRHTCKQGHRGCPVGDSRNRVVVQSAGLGTWRVFSRIFTSPGVKEQRCSSDIGPGLQQPSVRVRAQCLGPRRRQHKWGDVLEFWMHVNKSPLLLLFKNC